MHDQSGFAPFVTLPPLLTGRKSKSIIAEIAAERRRQIELFGHTPERDRAIPVFSMCKQCASFIRGAVDHVQFRKLDIARRWLVKTAALIVATIERIDFEIERGPEVI
jgi:hypothetical protein